MKKFVTFFVTIAVVLCSGIVMTSCEEDETTTKIIYTAIFTKFEESSSSTTGSPLTEMSEIQAIFYSELGITGTPFEKEGTVEKCDAEIRKACGRAVERLNQKTWHSKWIFEVYNANTRQVVVSISNSENFI